MTRMQKNILAGKSNEGFRSVNQVDGVPKAFKDWVENNQDRIVRAKALPYFLRDNGKVVDGKWVYKDERISVRPHYISEAEFEKLSKTMSVTDKEKHVLYDSDDLYIDSSWSRTINSELAEAKVGKVVPDGFMDKGSLEQIRTLDAVIDKNTLPEDMWLYRKVYPQWLKRDGVDFSVGSIVHEYGFTSTSAVEGANVMRKGKDVLLEIRAPKGTKAFVSANSEESEVILPRNTKFKVVSVSDRDGKKVIRLDIVSDDIHKLGASSLYETKESKRKAEEAIVKPENNKPLIFSKRQIQNHKELEEAIGVKQGDQMTIPEADYGKGNAYHGTDTLYDENCTLVSFAYELRRRGFPVTAFKAAEGSLAWDVGDDYKLAWVKTTNNNFRRE